VRDVTNRCGEFQNGTRGLKAGSSSPHATRLLRLRSGQALKGPLFHGIVGGTGRGECIAGIDRWKGARQRRVSVGSDVEERRLNATCGEVEERRFSAALALS